MNRSERPGWISETRSRLARLSGAVRSDRQLYIASLILLSIDLAWTFWWGGTRLLYNLDITQDLYEIKALRIDAEGGYPEWYSYAKTLVLVILLARLAQTRRQWIYVALAVLFALVLADDKLTIHEIGGEYFARALELRPMIGLRAVDLGEVITWGILGVLMAPLILFGFLRSTRTHVTNGLALLVPFGMLVFFGMIVDQAYHVLRNAFFGADILLGMLEDGGEMVSITAACALAAALVKHGSCDSAVSGIAEQ